MMCVGVGVWVRLCVTVCVCFCALVGIYYTICVRKNNIVPPNLLESRFVAFLAERSLIAFLHAECARTDTQSHM